MTTKIVPMRDAVVEIPVAMREHFGIDEDALVTIEAGDDGIVLRPADWPQPETYTPERIAEFLLNNAIDEADYAWAVAEVREMGIDPDSIPHRLPVGR